MARRFLWRAGGWVLIALFAATAFGQDGPGESPSGDGPALELLPPIDEPPAAAEVVPPGEITEQPIDVGPPPVDIWEGTLELGLNGSEGNSQVFNLRSGAKVTRKVPGNTLTLDLSYKKNTSDSLETANRLFFDGRDEWIFEPTPWTYYIHETTEYDEFRAFDVRVTADTGVGYQFVKSEITTLTGRLGGGFSHEIGGPDESYVPEAVFGLSLERQLSKRQKITAGVDYYPDVSQFSEYRVNSQADWQILLDEAAHLTLKLGIVDRYDSTPNGAKPNDLDYAATLLWSF